MFTSVFNNVLPLNMQTIVQFFVLKRSLVKVP